MSYVEILHEESAIHPIWNKILVLCAYGICPEHNHSLEVKYAKESALLSFIWNQPSSKERKLVKLIWRE